MKGAYWSICHILTGVTQKRWLLHWDLNPGSPIAQVGLSHLFPTLCLIHLHLSQSMEMSRFSFFLKALGKKWKDERSNSASAWLWAPGEAVILHQVIFLLNLRRTKPASSGNWNDLKGTVKEDINFSLEIFSTEIFEISTVR